MTPRRIDPPENLIAALTAAVADGDGRAIHRARQRILWRIDRDADPDLRMAFAEHYRSSGAASQAARWGIVTTGWATDREVHELRHWLLGHSRDGDFVRGALSLRPDDPLPTEVADLVEPSLRASRAPQPPDAGDAGCWWLLVAVLAALVACVCGLVIVTKAAHDDPDLFESARTLSAIGAWSGAIALLAFAISRWAGRRASRVLDRRASDTPLDGSYAVRLARHLAESGDVRGGEILLRARVRLSGDEEARRTLLHWARRDGRTDQAGRWGIGLPGETTPGERESYARAIRAAAGPEARIDALCALSSVPWSELSPDAKDVLRRARAEEEIAASASPREPPFWAWCVGVAVFVVGGTVTGVLAVRGEALAVPWARWTLASVCAVFGLLIVVYTVYGRPRPSGPLLISGLVTGVALLLGGVALLVAAVS